MSVWKGSKNSFEWLLAYFSLTPSKIQEILEVKKAIQTMNPDYDIIIKRLHLYYDMKLVSFIIYRDKYLIIQFPIFIQPYTQQTLILYQIETVLVPHLG